MLSLAWGGTVGILAAGLGVELDEIREVHERAPAPRTYDLGFGTVEEGTQAGLRFEVQGIVDGEPRIIVEHVTRIATRTRSRPTGRACRAGAATASRSRATRTSSCDFHDGGRGRRPQRRRAARDRHAVLNAIPAVCAAEPGVLSTLDLPLVTGTGTMR